MDRSNVINLISKTYAADSIGQYKPELSAREVYCDVRSITRAEWYDAGRQGFKPDISFVMFAPDYQGEDEVEYNSRKYSIYRTYLAQNEALELYCQSIGGVAQADPEEPVTPVTPEEPGDNDGEQEDQS